MGLGWVGGWCVTPGPPLPGAAGLLKGTPGVPLHHSVALRCFDRVVLNLGVGGGGRKWGPSSLRLAVHDMQCN